MKVEKMGGFEVITTPIAGRNIYFIYSRDVHDAKKNIRIAEEIMKLAKDVLRITGKGRKLAKRRGK